jgi:hypothetical protein
MFGGGGDGDRGEGGKGSRDGEKRVFKYVKAKENKEEEGAIACESSPSH